MRVQKIKLSVFKAKSGEWYWHGKRAGDLVCTSGEGYTRKLDAIRALRHFVDAMVSLKFSIKL